MLLSHPNFLPPLFFFACLPLKWNTFLALLKGFPPLIPCQLRGRARITLASPTISRLVTCSAFSLLSVRWAEVDYQTSFPFKLNSIFFFCFFPAYILRGEFRITSIQFSLTQRVIFSFITRFKDKW